MGVTTATCLSVLLPLIMKKATTATLAARSDPTVMRMPPEPLALPNRRATGGRTDTNDDDGGISAAATFTGSSGGISAAVARRASRASVTRACKAS